MKNIIFGLLIIISSNASAAWQNPSEKYINEYKNHLDVTCPISKSKIKHFVYFAKDRGKIKNHPLLTMSAFSGAQIMYSWRELEPEKNYYNFAKIEADLSYLASHHKNLFIQLQDTSFNPKYKAAPDYLLTPEYDDGATPQYSDDQKVEGWVTKRWNPAVQVRFARLLEKLGEQFDGRIAGINLQESSIGVSNATDPSFSGEKYVESLKINMKALKQAFPHSVTMQYANFMPGEWLPWEDKGYLKSIYQYGEEIGVGLGAPDLMIRRKGQLNHALTMMHENSFHVPLGIAVQDGNYIGQTNNDNVLKDRTNLVPMLYSFAANFLRVNYMFWVDQSPYFAEDVIPCFTEMK